MENPTSSDVAALQERVTLLERRSRRLWAAMLALAVVTAGSVAMGVEAASGSMGVIEAGWFVLKASDTEVRAELIVDPEDGAGKLRLYGGNGELTLELPAKQELLPLSAAGRPTRQ